MPGRVIVAAMGQRANQSPQMTALGQLGQMLAYLSARRPRGDGLELTTYFRRRIRLQIETVLLCQTAAQKNIDDGSIGGCLRLGGPQCGQMAHPQPEQSNGPGLNGRAPGENRVLKGSRAGHDRARETRLAG